MKFLKYNPFNLNNLGVKPIYRVSKSVREREREKQRDIVCCTWGRYCVMYLIETSEISVPLRTNFERFFSLDFLSSKPEIEHVAG